jgi:hypothetical protein
LNLFDTVAVVSQEIDYRIPRNLVPEHYDIEIRPDFYAPLQPSEFFLDGWVTVHMRCVTPTNLIHLHFRSMTINQQSVDVTEGENPAISIVSMSIDSVREFFIIEVWLRILLKNSQAPKSPLYVWLLHLIIIIINIYLVT